jgi:signal transduction histidine kinase
LVHNSRKSLTENLNQSSQAFAALATRPIGDSYAIYEDSGSVRVAQEIDKFTELNSDVSNIAIYDVNGNLLYALHSRPALNVTSQAAESFSAIDKKNSLGAIVQVIQPYLNDNGFHDYAIAYSISTTTLENSISRQAETILLFTILGLMVTAIVTYWLVDKLFLQPINSISSESLVISQGDYSKQIKSHRNDEIGVLASSVNQMATNLKNDIFKLQEADTLKNEFIMITSHNLRTPLTIIKGNMEIIHDSQLPDKLQLMFAAMENGLNRLESFSEDMLIISSVESEHATLANQPLSIKELLMGLETKYTVTSDLKHVNLHWQVDDNEVKVNVSSTHIRSVIRNLLDNAIKFTNKNGNAWFNLGVHDGGLKIEVRDDGIGIAPEEMRKLFQKFHRGTSITYRYDYEGTGIGLYATKLIAQAYGGKVTVSSTLGHGSVFTVLIPGVATNH